MNLQIIHRLKYFAERFARIPKNLWTNTWRHTNNKGVVRYCALGHLGALGPDPQHMTPEAVELCDLLRPITNHPDERAVTCINDSAGYIPGKDPQERILKALKMRMEMEQAKIETP